MSKTADEIAVRKFIEEFVRPRVQNPHDKVQLVSAVARAFENIPYENLSKLIGSERNVKFQTPADLVKGYFEHGTGGTCFPLVFLAKKVLDELGIPSYIALAHRTYAPSSHCVAVAKVGDEKFIIDVGYSVFVPVRMPGEDDRVLLKLPQGKLEFWRFGRRIFVSSVYDPLPGAKKEEHRRFRYVIFDEPADDETFFGAWEKTFDFDMMNHNVVVKLHRNRMYYIRDRFVHEISDGRTKRRELDENEVLKLVRELGISGEVWTRARSLVRKKGV